MQLDGREIADKLYKKFKERVENLKKGNSIPHLVVMLVGENPASVAYVALKQRKAEEIGAKVTILRYKTNVTTEELVEKIKLLNDDPFVHGILLQRPLPEKVNVEILEMAVDPQKDIDGFHPKSPYTFPLSLAILHILENVYEAQREKTKDQTFKPWIESQDIVILGKGKTGGGPVAAYLKKIDAKIHIIDTKTNSPEKLIQEADIVISAVGGKKAVTATMLKEGVVLIGVGMSRGENKKLYGDYEEDEIKDIASYYTPTPGGVGPVNVAMLMGNLLTATEEQTTH